MRKISNIMGLWVTDASYFEPLLAHFEQLRLIYEAEEKEEGHA